MFTRAANPSQLIVDVQFLEHGQGDKARLVYEPASASGVIGAACFPAGILIVELADRAGGTIDHRNSTRVARRTCGPDDARILVEDLGSRRPSPAA